MLLQFKFLIIVNFLAHVKYIFSSQIRCLRLIVQKLKQMWIGIGDPSWIRTSLCPIQEGSHLLKINEHGQDLRHAKLNISKGTLGLIQVKHPCICLMHQFFASN